MRLRFWNRREPDPEPSRPHPFRQVDDPGIAAFAAGGGAMQRWNPTAAIMTDNYIRKSRCGVPGCGRDRHDPIHEVDPES